MSKREAFLESCCTENVDDFLRFIQLHRNKTEPFDVEEVLQEMNRDQRQTLWGKLSSLLQDVLQEERREEGSEERREEAMEVEAAADPSHVRSVVDGVTLVAAESLKVLQDGETYSSLLEIIHRLHDLLELQPVSEAPLQLQILRLCDAWWKKDLKEKETFGRSAMIIALTKSFDLKKPGTEIQRVWSLREVLLGLDYTSEDNKQMMDLLLKCFQRPAFLRNDDEKGNVKRKKVQIMEKIESKPDLALDYLEYLFTHSSTREKVLDLDQRKLTQLHKVLENWRV
ncbi:condensin-2 complex subunit G2-like [Gymnodraco acuticeps]|uniref:Condensin-2 complex subunit G2-like n=1 Tax=Gymnodraco acuticeps TaxID=8218 RepID=A0A6P8TPX2_GYMAC|nr:condensin-2 complex subunit G2-like [Gymnodraco acuticeps]